MVWKFVDSNLTYRRGKTYRRLVIEEVAAALIWALVFAGVMLTMP